MGISTLSNRTVKLNRSDTGDSKREKTSAKTVKPQEITTSKTTTTTKPTEPATKPSPTMPTLKRETTEKPQPANQQRCKCQHKRPFLSSPESEYEIFFVNKLIIIIIIIIIIIDIYPGIFTHQDII